MEPHVYPLRPPHPIPTGTQFARLKDCIGESFTDPKNGNWTLIADGFNPYNRVTHSCFVVGITCNDLPVDAYARANNARVLAIVPGPEAPNNLHVCRLPLLQMMATAAGGLDGQGELAPLRVRGHLPGGETEEFDHIPFLVGVSADRMAQVKFTGVRGPARASAATTASLRVSVVAFCRAD